MDRDIVASSILVELELPQGVADYDGLPKVSKDYEVYLAKR